MSPHIVIDDAYTVLSSGSVLQLNRDTPLSMYLTENDGTKMGVRFEFSKMPESDESSKGTIVMGGRGNASAHLSMHDVDTVKVQVALQDFVSNFGLLHPFKIGTYNGKELLFNFRVSINGDGDPAIIHYTWFIRNS